MSSSSLDGESNFQSTDGVDSWPTANRLRSRYPHTINRDNNNTSRSLPTPLSVMTASSSSLPASLSSPSPRLLSRGRTLTRVETWTEALYSPYSIQIYHHAQRALAYGVNIYILLLCLPLGILAGTLGWHPLLVSIFNFLAIIPLSALVSDTSDRLSDHFGDIVGSLINATCGNCVELTSGILALVNGRIAFAQSVMIGSILSDLLLVLGFCLLSASWGKNVMRFNPGAAETLSSLMIITTMAIIMPTALHSVFASQHSPIIDKITSFSRGTAVILLLLYLCYIYFQMKTHKHLFVEASEQYEETTEDDDSPSSSTLVQKVYIPMATLAGSSLAIILCTHFVMQNMGYITRVMHVSGSFIALILIPIISNSSEGAAVVAVSRSGNVDFAVSIIVGSILQIGLLAIPVLVVLGWIFQQEVTLLFDSFNMIVFFFSVMAVSYMLREGKYTYMHGAMLVGFYFVLTIAFYFR